MRILGEMGIRVDPEQEEGDQRRGALMQFVGRRDDLDLQEIRQAIDEGFTVLAIDRETVRHINQHFLEDLPGRRVRWSAMWRYGHQGRPVEAYGGEDVDPAEHERQRELLFKNSPYLETLDLKPGCEVMLLKNYLNRRDHKLVNGSRGRVVSIERRPLPGITLIPPSPTFSSLLDAHVLAGTSTPFNTPLVRFYDKGGFTPPIPIYPEEWEFRIGGIVMGSVVQLPLSVSYALTIRKAQGLTLRAYVILGGTSSPGHLYVALSRAPSLRDLRISQGPLRPTSDKAAIKYYSRLSLEQAEREDARASANEGTGITVVRDGILESDTPEEAAVSRAMQRASSGRGEDQEDEEEQGPGERNLRRLLAPIIADEEEELSQTELSDYVEDFIETHRDVWGINERNIRRTWETYLSDRRGADLEDEEERDTYEPMEEVSETQSQRSQGRMAPLSQRSEASSSSQAALREREILESLLMLDEGALLSQEEMMGLGRGAP